jgi:23S rRNA pseudouridine2457 synthase
MHHRYFVLNKPYGYLSQFTPEGKWQGLGALHAFPPDVYPVGRLDADSEGLLILTNDTQLNYALLHPAKGHRRMYLAQVEGTGNTEALKTLVNGVSISINGKTHLAKALEAYWVQEPKLWERSVPIRFRKNVPTSWLQLTLGEGKNHQVKKMTAAVGFPTLRLVRTAIETLEIGDLTIGGVREYTRKELYTLLRIV